jgi:hypothetical protein
MGSIVGTGVDSRIQRTSDVPSSSTAFTMAGWFKLAAGDAGTSREIMCIQPASGGRFLRVNASNYLQLLSSTYGAVPGTVTIPTGEWLYFAMVGKGTAQDDHLAYVWSADGTLLDSVATDSLSLTFTNMTALNQGSGSFGNSAKCAYVRVWGSALTSTVLHDDEMFSSTVVTTTDFNSGFIDADTLGVSPQASRTWTTSNTTTDTGDTPPVSAGEEQTVIYMVWEM